VVAWTLLLIGGLVMVTPIIFMFSTSLKTSAEVYDLRLIPANPTLENYWAVMADGRFLRWFFNSFFIAAIVTVSTSSSTVWSATRWPSSSSVGAASSSSPFCRR
jgi:multiple sugar transport system permease protein